MTCSGDLSQVDLDAVTEQMCRKRLSGVISGSLTKAVIDAGLIRSLEGRLHVADLQTAGLLAMAGYPAATGSLTLEIPEARYAHGRVTALLATGQMRDLNIAPLLRYCYGGVISGRLNANLEKLRVIDGRLDELAADVRIMPPADGGIIDRQILTTVARRMLGVDLPPVLPETIGYTDLGARLNGADDELYVEGLAGPDQKYLLVVDVPPMPMPLIAQPAAPLPLQRLQRPVLETLASIQKTLADWATSLVTSNR